METVKESAELNMEVIESFIVNDYTPSEFLNKLHDVIVGLVLLAGQASPIADIKDLAGYTEFLSGMYDAVRAASR